MAHIVTPAPTETPVKSVDDFLKAIEPWQKLVAGADVDRFLSQLWYRGVNKIFPNQIPGLHRPDCLVAGGKLMKNGSDEDKKLRFEREAMSQFRTAGAVYLTDTSTVGVYFTAQHFGMPTRLLDWSTNPLAGLFFACDGPPEKAAENGVVYAMDARKVIPDDATKDGKAKLYQAIMSMRHPYVEYAVKVAFWNDLDAAKYKPYVLPVRPDFLPGRISQQSSCFTLHMHKAPPASNKTLITLAVDAASKPSILAELHRLNINQYTIYGDLDHLSKEIKRSWGVR